MSARVETLEADLRRTEQRAERDATTANRASTTGKLFASCSQVPHSCHCNLCQSTKKAALVSPLYQLAIPQNMYCMCTFAIVYGLVASYGIVVD